MISDLFDIGDLQFDIRRTSHIDLEHTILFYIYTENLQ